MFHFQNFLLALNTHSFVALISVLVWLRFYIFIYSFSLSSFCIPTKVNYRSKWFLNINSTIYSNRTTFVLSTLRSSRKNPHANNENIQCKMTRKSYFNAEIVPKNVRKKRIVSETKSVKRVFFLTFFFYFGALLFIDSIIRFQLHSFSVVFILLFSLFLSSSVSTGAVHFIFQVAIRRMFTKLTFNVMSAMLHCMGMRFGRLPLLFSWLQRKMSCIKKHNDSLLTKVKQCSAISSMCMWIFCHSIGRCVFVLTSNRKRLEREKASDA